MPDRSSHQGLPEDWNHGSHAARGPFWPAGAPNGHGAGKTGSHRARTADGHGAAPTAEDALGSRAESHGTGNGEAFDATADAYGAGRTDAYPVRLADAYGTAAGDAHAGDAYGTVAGDAYGAAAGNPFGDADPSGARAADPFGPARTGPFAAETARPDAQPPVTAVGDPPPGEAADARGFVGALFDFGFTSFVTPKVIKVLYMLIVIGTVVSALMFTIVVFKASVTFGFLMLVFGDPLFILIVLAIYRIILEFFVVTFRVAEDIRALRERGGLS